MWSRRSAPALAAEKNLGGIPMKSLRILALAAALLMGFTMSAMAAGNCSKKIESFDFVVDYSGSMMMSNKKMGMDKILVAKKALANVNAAVPALDYNGGLHTMTPGGTLVQQGPWDRNTMAAGIAKIKSVNEVFGRMTYMGDGIQKYEPFLSALKRDAALILVTDGDNNRGADFVATISAMYASQRNLIVHIISLADTPNGEANIRKIAALNPNTVVVRAEELATNEAAVADFVTRVFCKEGEEVIVLRGVNFAFDSDKLDARAMGILDEAANMVKAQPNTRVVLTGYTDSKGTDAYNAKLSQRRATSVKNYLAQQGVPASRMTAVGQGKSFKYDNSTENGRYMNRRTELSFK